MSASEPLSRYGVITKKNPREILLLRGTGCQWRRCRFCDYHLDFSLDEEKNFALNREILSKVTGEYKRLEVINSGSFFDLDEKTKNAVFSVCKEKGIENLHAESHWIHKEEILPLKKKFKDEGIALRFKIGAETFDSLFRESYLDKGMAGVTPSEMAEYFDEVCLLQGIPGQTLRSMEKDIETGLRNFERVCVNIMIENSKPIKPDPSVISAFIREIYPKYKDDKRVDILLNNTDFGVGDAGKEGE